MSGATSERRRCFEHRTGQDRQKLPTMCTKRPNKRCALHVQRNTTPTPIARTPQTCLNFTKLHVSIGLLDHCSVLDGMNLLSDANTMGTFSDEYPVADLDMFVLATTQRITSILSLRAPTPTKNTMQKMAKPTPFMRMATQSWASSCVRNKEMRLNVYAGFTNTRRIPERNESKSKEKRADGSTTVGEETVVAGCVRNRIVWLCVNKKMHLPTWPHESHDLLLLLKT